MGRKATNNHHESMVQQGRAKACSNCAKSKKRCDLVIPLCSRCSNKGLHCEYNLNTNGIVSENSKNQDDGNGGLWTDQFDMTKDSAPIIAVPFESHTPLLPIGILPQNVNMDQDLADHASLMTIRANLLETKHLAEKMDRKTLQLMTTIICSYPCLFLRRMELSFIHHSLYADCMPEAMQNAIKICALFAAKTGQNETIIFKLLNAEVDNLNPNCETLLESTHALLFYQIICLFDGNIRQRVLAEKQMGKLNTWASKLQSSAQLEIYGDWQGWIKHQTVLRTVILIRFLDLVYGIIRNLKWYSQDCICFVAVETNVRMWKARTACEWEQAKQFSVPADFLCTADLDVHTVETIDPFRLFLLTATHGVDFMEKWAGVNDYTQMMLQAA